MGKYSCEKCGREFKQKSHYKKHLQRKTPCVKEDKLKEIVSKLVDEKLGIVPSKVRISLKPLVKWSGGKKDEIKKIMPHIPTDYQTYIEPFVGGGALYFHLNPQKAIINDVHKELIDFYQAVKDGRSEDIYTFMKEHPNEESVYYKVRAYEPTTGLENARRFYYLRKTCFRGMLRYNKKGKFNIPFGRYKTYKFEDLKNKDYERLLQGTDIFNKGFEDIFKEYDNENNFMFLDPPYDSEFTDYGYCQFGKEEHKKLATCFKNTKVKCLMIIGKTDFICDLYKGYIAGEYDKKYRFKIHSNRVGSEINNKHLIIKNY